jgi:CRP-like cAMP-binding protein
VNSAEQIWGMLYMLLNIIAQAWMIGSITLLIVKQDEKTGAYRDTMASLANYAALHDFPKKLRKSLKTQLELEFNSRELSDETVLSNFPDAVRRKVLRRLYLPYLMQTSLMRGIRQQFVDAFLSTCKVEIFSPGEEILTRGSVCADLYLLVSGVVQASTPVDFSTAEETSLRASRSNYGGTSIGDSSKRTNDTRTKELGPGEFIDEIGFFTESPQVETVKTKTICKTLTMSRVAYKCIAEDHPGSVGKVLQNLLEKVEAEAAKSGSAQNISLPTRLTIIRAGSTFDDSVGVRGDDFEKVVKQAQTEAALGSVQDIVEVRVGGYANRIDCCYCIVGQHMIPPPRRHI